MRLRIEKYLSFFVCLAVILVFSVSCSRSKPEIAYGFIQLVLYEGDPEPREQYSFFIIPEDEDGMENLDILYLYHDREQLSWRINSDEWVSFLEGGTNWIGTRSISVRDGNLPRGLFRAVLVNKGGESSESSFTFDGAVRYPFPELEITGGMYTVRSEWPVNRLICYDREGTYSATVELPLHTGSVSQLNLSSSVMTAALWAEDESNFCSAFTNVVPVR